MSSDFNIVPCSQEQVLMAFFIGRGFNFVNSLLFLVRGFFKEVAKFLFFFHSCWDPISEQLIESPAYFHTNALVYPCDCWRQDPYTPPVIIISSRSAGLQSALQDPFTDTCFMSLPSPCIPTTLLLANAEQMGSHSEPGMCGPVVVLKDWG